MKPIYRPKGSAAEYGDYAINIYTGCPHRCYYCFAPSVLRKDREIFHSCVEPRKDIYRETMKQLDREHITGKLIHLCFTCDPYPSGVDNSMTRDIIKLLKSSGNHIQILTKGDGSRDFDLLDENDWYGITYTGAETCFEPRADHANFRIMSLMEAGGKGIKTWVSCEPVINAKRVVDFIENVEGIDLIKIGKLNYYASSINWHDFGHEVEKICKERGLNYYIKDSLRSEMEVGFQ